MKNADELRLYERHGIRPEHVVRSRIEEVLVDGRCLIRAEIDIVGVWAGARLLPAVSSDSVPVSRLTVEEPVPDTRG